MKGYIFYSQAKYNIIDMGPYIPNCSYNIL